MTSKPFVQQCLEYQREHKGEENTGESVRGSNEEASVQNDENMVDVEDWSSPSSITDPDQGQESTHSPINSAVDNSISPVAPRGNKFPDSDFSYITKRAKMFEDKETRGD